MSTGQSVSAWAKQARALISAKRQNQQASNNGFWSWINAVATGVNHLLSGSLSNFARAEGDWAHLILWWDREVYHGYQKLATWAINSLLAPLRQYVNRRIAYVIMLLAVQFRQLRQMIAQAKRDAYQYARELFRLEQTLRIQADQALDREIKTRIKWLHQALEREAVSGYKLAYDQRVSTITRVADLIGVQNPLVRGLVKRLVSGLLDLAAVDDPLARLVLSFLLKHIIDRLGLDRVIGNLLQRMLQPLLGAPRPRGLPEVIADLSQRLNGLDAQWAEFMANGGAEVEQAGQEWQGVTSLIGDAALLAFLGTMCYRPAEFASEVTSGVNALVNDTISGAKDLLGKG